MTPVEPVPPAPLEANQQGSTSQSQQPSPERAVELPAAGQTIITPPYSEHETPMINGQPAKFRPMNLNVNTPTQ
jgi:hypothetical protein